MKKISILFGILSLVLSHVMCVVVAYSYAAMQCSIAHGGTSAPDWIAFLYAIPFLLGILLCGGVSYIVWRRSRN